MGKDYKIGIFFATATFVMWGILPVYFKQIQHINAVEILANRIFWSSIILFLILNFTKNSKDRLKLIISDKKTLNMLIFTGILISLNWGIYVYAVNTNRILECGLGYFINPMIYMILGVVILKEKIDIFGKISILLVFIAIIFQIFSVGNLPLISILLASTFAMYGLLKKRLNSPPLESLFIETLLPFTLSTIYIAYIQLKGFGNLGLNIDGLLLILCGIVTIVPLFTFNIATNKIKLSTIGFMQYISPTIAIIIAIFIYKEELDIFKTLSFTLIWISLILISIKNINNRR